MFDFVYLGTDFIDKIYLGTIPIDYNSTKIPNNAFAVYTVSYTDTLPTIEGCSYQKIYRYREDGTCTVILTSSSRPTKISFSSMQNLLSVEYIDLSNIKDMSMMFFSCTNLKEVKGLSAFNVNMVASTNSMFRNCWSLKQVDLSKWNTTYLKNMKDMFDDCRLLEYLDISNFCVHSTDIDLMGIIEDNGSLKTIRMDNCDALTIENLISGRVHVDGANPSVTVYCRKSNATYSLPTGWSYELLGDPYIVGQFRDDKTITRVDESTVSVDSTHTDLSEMFYGCRSLNYVDASSWDTRNVTTMSSMFSNCASYISELNLSNWTINGTDLSYMFAYNGTINRIDMNNWKLSGTINMSNFDYSATITTIDMSNWDLSEATLKTSNIFKNVGTIRLDNCDKETIRKITDKIGYGKCTNVFIKRANDPGNEDDDFFVYVYID